ncbi:MAG: NUDIX domain-containing protein [Clostridiales bacterium]
MEKTCDFTADRMSIDENVEETLIREVIEETGITVRDTKLK